MTALHALLDTNGDRTGETNATDDYSDDPVDFWTRYPLTATIADVILHTLTVQIADRGSLDAHKYGNNIELENGISVGLYDVNGNVIDDLTNGHPIITNADWSRAAGKDHLADYGQGPQYLSVQWDFGPMTILPGQSFRVRLNDDFSKLIKHTFHLKGEVG